MHNIKTRLSGIVTGAVALAVCGAAFAQVSVSGRLPEQSDFDTCNRETQLSSGSALPGATAPTGPTRVPAGTGLGATSAAGATGGTGSLSGGSTLSGSGPAAAGDPALRGMASGQTDPSHQQVYQDCMRRRGF
jgi:hypothetical protein